MRFIYVAGPISKGTTERHVRAACLAADRLVRAGLRPFVPQLSILWNMVIPEASGYDYWLPYDFDWIRKCDAVLRMPGESFGADREVEFANRHNIPVYNSLEHLLEDAHLHQARRVEVKV